MTNFKQKILKDFSSSIKLQYCLDSIGDDEEKLMFFLHCFVEYNMPFAAGVTGLVSVLHSSQNFHKQDYDSSADIASYVFGAAEDEYVDRDTGERITHKRLAQEFRRVASKLLKVDWNNMETFLFSDRIVSGYTGKSYKAYEANGIGFHIGSEVLASDEFNVIDKYLHEKWPDFVNDMKGVEIIGKKDAYCWLKIHTYFEEEHADLGFRAYDLGREYWKRSRKEDRDEFEKYAYAGVEEFAKLQDICFDRILYDLNNPQWIL